MDDFPHCGSNSALAQLVEQLTVNQLVAGSSPARGASKAPVKTGAFLFLEFYDFQMILNFPYIRITCHPE
jgi:hypothetical protein